MTIPVVTPCDLAEERWRWIKKWRELWTLLVFAFGTAIILFLITAILLLIGDSLIPSAVTGVGTVASSVATRWVVARRSEAVQEEKDAWAAWEWTCGKDKVNSAIKEGRLPPPSRDVVPRSEIVHRTAGT